MYYQTIDYLYVVGFWTTYIWQVKSDLDADVEMKILQYQLANIRDITRKEDDDIEALSVIFSIVGACVLIFWWVVLPYFMFIKR